MALESRIAATNRRRPPQSGHSSTSMSSPRRMSSAQVRLCESMTFFGMLADDALLNLWPPEVHDLPSPLGVRREHAVIDDEVDVGARNQRGELFEELQRLKGDVARPIPPWRFEPHEHASIATQTTSGPPRRAAAGDIGKGARAWGGSWRGRRCWREGRNHRGGLVADLSGKRASPSTRLRGGAPLHLRVVPWRPVDGRTPRRARAMAEPPCSSRPSSGSFDNKPRRTSRRRTRPRMTGRGALRSPRRWALWRLRRRASRPALARRPRRAPAYGSARSS